MEHEERQQDTNESLPSTRSCHQDNEKLHDENTFECSNTTGSHVILEVMDEEKKKADSVVLQLKSDHTNTKHDFYGDQKICRICHLGLESSCTELIQIGCGCKGELGVSHLACARTWFIQKGDRVCEICGKAAANVNGLEHVLNNVMTIDLMVEWGDTRLLREAAAARASSAAVSDKCLRTFRNIILACLLLAFVVPWFFRA